MGVISNAIDSLEKWCCDLFKDGIKSQFDGISELMTDTFAKTMDGSTGLVNSFLTKHPAQFTGTAGSADSGYGIWGTVETLFNSMITSLNSSSDGVIMQMAMLMGYTAALIFTVLRTGAISKSIFNAR